MKDESKAKKIPVYLRLKPGNSGEQVLFTTGDDENKVRLHGKDYTFNKVLDSNSKSQHDVYTETVLPLVQNVLDGHDSLLFTMGSSGSGKSYTVFGDGSKANGAVHMALDTIFTKLDEVNISMTEIYNDKVVDLLAPGKTRSLAIKTMPTSRKTYLAGLTRHTVASLESAHAILNSGQKMRSCYSTGSNSVSSRSHAFIYIELANTQRSTLTVADLAGTERNKLAKTEGERFQESCAINQSLMLLGQCLQRGGSSSVNEFRSCKLTHLLLSNAFLPGSTQKSALIVAADPYGDGNSIAQIFRYSAAAMEILQPKQSDIKPPQPNVASRQNSNIYERLYSTPRGSISVHESPQKVVEVSESEAIEISESEDGDNDFSFEQDQEEASAALQLTTRTPRNILLARITDLEERLAVSTQREQDLEDDLRTELYDEMENKLDTFRSEFLDMREAESSMLQNHIDDKIRLTVEAMKDQSTASDKPHFDLEQRALSLIQENLLLQQENTVLSKKRPADTSNDSTEHYRKAMVSPMYNRTR